MIEATVADRDSIRIANQAIADMKRLGATIVDPVNFDGVIADTEPLHFESLRRTLADIEIILTEQDYYANYLGFDDRGCILEALRINRHPIVPSLIEEQQPRK